MNYKFKTILQIIFSLFILSGIGYSGETIKYGLFLGGNGSSIFGEYSSDAIFKAGLYGGISLEKEILDNLFFKSGVYYINKGFKTQKIESEDYENKEERYYFYSEYIEVPFLIQFKGSILEFESNWMTGLGAAFNIHNQGETKIDDKTYTVDVEDDIRFYDITIILGTNKMISQYFNLDLRASAGLLPYDTRSDFLGKRHVSVILSLGYYL